MKYCCNVTKKMGVTGLAILFCLNIMALFIQDLTVETWFAAWFPSYLVWITFIIIGIRQNRQ